MSQSGSNLTSALDFELFIGSMETRMMQTVWRITRNQADAEDAVQAALSVAWRRREVLAMHPNPQALLLKICIDTSLDLVKKNRSVRSTWEKYSQINSAMDNASAKLPSSRMESDESVTKLLQEIRSLPRNLCQAVLMRLVDEMPYNEIASALGCTEVAARKYVQRGRDELRNRLANLETNPTSGVIS